MVTVVGFDLRVKDAADVWQKEHRETFLLDPSGPPPRSADRFARPQVPGLPSTPPAWDLWLDLEAVERAIVGLPGMLVALALHDAGAHFPAARPEHPGPGWRLLGYDVVDTGLLSAVCDFGAVSGYDCVPALRARWGPLLNENGLFAHLDDASTFRAYSEVREPAHAPFFVCEVWLLPRSEAS